MAPGGGRPQLDIGTWGEITVTRIGVGKHRARALYRDRDGVARQVQRVGSSPTDARRRLREAFATRRAAGGADITGETRLRDAAKSWFAEARTGGVLTTQTVDIYEQTWKSTIDKQLGHLRLREATTSTVDRFLKGIVADDKLGSARMARVVLSKVFAMAARHDAIEHNPVTNTAPIPRSKKDPRALTPEEMILLRSHIHAWQDSGRTDGGQPRSRDLIDMVDVMLGTGIRIGELVALRWADVALVDEGRSTITITGTAVVHKGTGLVRQNRPKSSKSFRRITIPEFVAAVLAKRQATADGSEFVFPARPKRPKGAPPDSPSGPGGMRAQGNVRRILKDALDGSGLEEWLTPHTFRRTVATLTAREGDLVAAAGQLGHSSTAITERHYVQRLVEAPDLSALLEKLG